MASEKGAGERPRGGGRTWGRRGSERGKERAGREGGARAGGPAVRDPLGILESSSFLPSAAGLVSTRIGTREDAVS
jgi:hypothetical protein